MTLLGLSPVTPRHDSASSEQPVPPTIESSVGTLDSRYLDTTMKSCESCFRRKPTHQNTQSSLAYTDKHTGYPTLLDDYGLFSWPFEDSMPFGQDFSVGQAPCTVDLVPPPISPMPVFDYDVPGDQMARDPSPQALFPFDTNHDGFTRELNGGAPVGYELTYSIPATTGEWMYNADNAFSSRTEVFPDLACLLTALPSPPSPPSPPSATNTKITTVSLRQHHCNSCSISFELRKDLKRHRNTVHATGNEPAYSCRCGKNDNRKDNHRRHVHSCKRGPCQPHYSCKCGVIHAEKQLYLDHVTACQYYFGSNGRPHAS
ncbi:hypothetical protein HD806DRAFT_493647 [Xylariaceae sp. AK1471]|nr:hypothetical protein HD806DRAFT_493647 [Xylariaceae sp. AK1471]